MLIIYGADLSAPGNKVRFAANAMNLEYEYKRVSLRNGEHLTAEYKKLHPASKVPVIDDGGFVLFESNAIIKYLARKSGSGFYPQDETQRAIVDQWIDFVSLHVGAALNKVVFNRLFAPVIHADVDERSLADGLKFLERFLPVLEAQLSANPYLAGKDMSLADINLLATLDAVEAAQVDITPYQALSKWRDSLKQQDFYTSCHKDFRDVLQQFTAKQS